MSLKYEPSSEPLHISAKLLFVNPQPIAVGDVGAGGAVRALAPRGQQAQVPFFASSYLLLSSLELSNTQVYEP